ncbi:MAG: hypothetical protein DWQ47_01135 [Acidobacteria bacterium]|nr:MAG: hypothetical protein DWQ32_11595 [Acidobacteriota bacterium]REK04105.1 MAG: hypothetical protein DWQ38_01120 [Acidobacteriota bacterium]REK15267.1 MAG: hypothetical protein DWQ43_17285 [Acidobacteriota bacterium]REK46357.1 MAG: hypothetical protein DWQ47_01135 [Acidobacteriota bacterium]
MENEKHNTYVGWAFIGNFIFQMLFNLFTLGMIAFFFSFNLPPGQPEFPVGIMVFLFVFMFVFQLLFTLPSLIAGYAVLKKKPWARVAAFVGAALSVMNVPVGTAVGVYALWYFVGEEWKQVYEPQNYRPRLGDLPPHIDSYTAQPRQGTEREPQPVPGQWRE